MAIFTQMGIEEEEPATQKAQQTIRTKQQRQRSDVMKLFGGAIMFVVLYFLISGQWLAALGLFLVDIALIKCVN